ncbi:integrase [uncultured phage_MedDCM-OCT-S35-C6]|jgi:integrase|uniref:Integrase n=1 Tax=uncultured phage_MedDCM-OCT-S35-C6 TaxID=2741075 RepID=A0A6S4PDS7_9CAUD|nr:integrase [uncultured phage_MedDCM-OCT-S35-C6]BAQ94188.1 integrase [uncultured phage_MedDCM-OCT-S35-C6]
MQQRNLKLLTEIHRKLTLKGWEKLQSKRADNIITMLGRGMLVTEINDSHIENLVDTLEDRGFAPATINRYLSAISKMLRFASQRQSIYHLDRMPHIEWQTENNGRERYLEPLEEQEIIKILTEWNKVDYLELYLFLMDTGMRLGEALSIKKLMVHNNNGDYVVNLPSSVTKNGDARGVPLTNRAKSIVVKLLENAERNDLVFRQLKYWTAENTWRRLRKAMNLEDDKEFVIHCLRHTCATRMAQSGKVELHFIGQMLGHKSWKMIKRYSHLIPNNLRGAVNVLNEVNTLNSNLSNNG